MASVTAICNSWVRDLGLAEHNHNPSGGHAFKAALYLTAAALGAATTAYSSTNEHGATGSYVTGGASVAVVAPVLDSGIAVYDWADPAWVGVTLNDVRSLGMYNDTHASNAMVFIVDFGGANAVAAGNLSVAFPAATAAAGIVRL